MWFLLPIVMMIGMEACLHAPRQHMLNPREGSSDNFGSAQGAKKSAQREAAPRFTDTSYVQLNLSKGSALTKLFDQAQEEFDLQQYDKAERGFAQLIETLDETDSLHPESRFMLAECSIQRGDYPKAYDRLQSLLATKNLNSSARERSLLRLGQVYCAQNKTDDALKTFQKFRREFPQSPYIGLASCAALNGKN